LLYSDCRVDELGVEYAGTSSTTVSGRTCQAWSSDTPHSHGYDDDEFIDGSRAAAQNYCRNPDDPPYEGGLWCYTTDPDMRWDFCDVPLC